MIQNFQIVFAQFEQKILSGKSYSEIRKSYLKLLKIYHPDKAEASQKKLYEEFTVKIVKLYQDYINQKISESGKDFSKRENQGKQKNQGSQAGARYEKETFKPAQQNQDSAYTKLMELARNEYIAYKKIGYDFILDQAERKERYEKYLKHLGTAVKCYKIVIKECLNPELVLAARKQLEWVQRLYDSYKNCNM